MKRKLCISLSLALALALLLTACAGGGQKQNTDEDDLILVTEIELLNTDVQTSSDGTRFVTVEADADGIWRYQISYCTHPDNASDRKADLMLVTANPSASIDEETGTVTLTRTGVAGVMLKGRDGSEANVTLYIYAK